MRIFNTYGPRMRPDDGCAIPNFVTQALAGAPITVQGDGDDDDATVGEDDATVGEDDANNGADTDNDAGDTDNDAGDTDNDAGDTDNGQAAA